MKRLLSVFLSAVLILGFACSCKEEKETDLSSDIDNFESSDKEEEEAGFSYRIDEFKYFSELLNKPELSAQQGEYKIKITGLDTPVVLHMDGMNLEKVTAYSRSSMVNIGTYQDDSPAHIEGAKGAVIISEDLDYDNKCWIFTEDNIYKLFPENGISTRVFVKGDGGLGYRRYWGEYVTSFEQWDTAPLDLCTSREHFLCEEGTAHISDGKVLLTPEKTVKLQDLYELDEMFEEAKENGMYAEYDSVDELFAANAAK